MACGELQVRVRRDRVGRGGSVIMNERDALRGMNVGRGYAAKKTEYQQVPPSNWLLNGGAGGMLERRTGSHRGVGHHDGSASSDANCALTLDTEHAASRPSESSR